MAKKKPTKVVKSFSDVYKGGLDSEGYLTDLVDKTMVIEGVEFTELGNYGDVAIVTIRVNSKVEKRHTFSQVLIKQLRAIQNDLPIKATIRKRKRYYTFE